MTQDIKIFQKRGCDKYAFKNCLLIKSSVAEVAAIIGQYFDRLELYQSCKIDDYRGAKKRFWQEQENQRQIRKERPKKSLPPLLCPVPFWQYYNHEWTVLPLSGKEDGIAFTLALLLDSEAITFHDSKHASFNEFRVFSGDRLIERYIFGSECGLKLDEDWDIVIKVAEFSEWSIYEHRFRSSVRQVSAAEIRAAFLSRKHERDNRGFFDACLKYYNAYIPVLEESPYHDSDQNAVDLWLTSSIERMDMILMPSNWSYVDRAVPDRVT
jgi:hypothetical protein